MRGNWKKPGPRRPSGRFLGGATRRQALDAVANGAVSAESVTDAVVICRECKRSAVARSRPAAVPVTEASQTEKQRTVGPSVQGFSSGGRFIRFMLQIFFSRRGMHRRPCRLRRRKLVFRALHASDALENAEDAEKRPSRAVRFRTASVSKAPSFPSLNRWILFRL